MSPWLRNAWLSASSLASACTYSVHQMAVSNFGDIREGQVVEAEAEQWVLLDMATDTDFADEAYERLLQQCPDGILRGIQARHSTSHSFLSYGNHLRMRAYCVPAAPEDGQL